jgi:hypothetical protein
MSCAPSRTTECRVVLGPKTWPQWLGEEKMDMLARQHSRRQREEQRCELDRADRRAMNHIDGEPPYFNYCGSEVGHRLLASARGFWDHI